MLMPHWYVKLPLCRDIIHYVRTFWKNVFIDIAYLYDSPRRADIINYVPTEGVFLYRTHVFLLLLLAVLCTSAAFRPTSSATSARPFTKTAGHGCVCWPQSPCSPTSASGSRPKPCCPCRGKRSRNTKPCHCTKTRHGWKCWWRKWKKAKDRPTTKGSGCPCQRRNWQCGIVRRRLKQ